MSEKVNRVILTERRRLPPYPDQQTFSESVVMSQGCQAATLRALRALFGGPSGAPHRSESVRRCERFLAYPGVPRQFVFQIEFGVRCPRVVGPGHDDIYHSRVEKRPNQCEGPHKSCHRSRQSTCA
jgi:hypothetical protein